MSDNETKEETTKRSASESSARLAGSVRIQRKFLSELVINNDWHDYSVRSALTSDDDAIRVAQELNSSAPDDVIFRAVRIITITEELHTPND